MSKPGNCSKEYKSPYGDACMTLCKDNNDLCVNTYCRYLIPVSTTKVEREHRINFLKRKE
jgi:hypothetical protein